MFTRLSFSATVSVLSACALASCGSASGGGGGGVVFNAGTTCQATMVTDQCGMDSGHAAVVHCVGGIWTVTQACAGSQVCVLKSGAPACVATGGGTGGTDATGGDDATGGSDATLSDTTQVEDTVQIEDVPVVVDIIATPDIAKDTGKDAGKDIGKDTSKPDVQAPKPTWGTCAITDQTCLQGCVQSSCTDAGQACVGDSACSALQDCNSNCGNTPIVMPVQSGTPIPQNPGETEQDYCYRVCSAQAGYTAVALNQAYLECVVGSCLDCSASSSGGITQAQCQGACAAENTCKSKFDACLNSADCLDLYGCLITAADATEQQTCMSNASSSASTTFDAFNTCMTNNATVCVAP